jgi:hypothetical protein
MCIMAMFYVRVAASIQKVRGEISFIIILCLDFCTAQFDISDHLWYFEQRQRISIEENSICKL